MKRLILKKELYQSLKDDEEFLESIQLCRILSAIQYNNVIYAMLSENEEFDTFLQLHLVIYHASLLYEGIKKFISMKPKLESLESFKESDKIIEEYFSENNAFYKDVLYQIRRKVAFHFDKHVIVRTLEKFITESNKENQEVVFIEGKTDLVKDMKFNLADNLNLNYIVGLIKGENLSYEEKFKALAQDLIKQSNLFCDILHEIIPELIKDYCELIEQEK